MDARPGTGADLTQPARSGIGPRWLMGPGRQAGKFLVNPLVVRTIAGRIGPYAVLRHVGRRSGRAYATPVWAASRGDAFMIALILGTETDWCRNVRAAGGCTLQIGGIGYALTGPQVVDQAAALPAFPVWIRLVARIVGIRHFLRLRVRALDAPPGPARANLTGPPGDQRRRAGRMRDDRRGGGA